MSTRCSVNMKGVANAGLNQQEDQGVEKSMGEFG